MTNQHRVVWDEGMMLAPQHFQQWERWIEGELRDRLQAATTSGWGFTALELDQGALASGELAITHCAGVFSDGTAFVSPLREALPPSRSLMEAVDAAKNGLTIYLAVPKVVSGAPSYAELGSNEAHNAPMLRNRMRVPDIVRPETDREISTAQLNLALKLEGDDLSAFRTMPIARLVRAAAGGVQMAPDFGPPSLTVAALPIAGSTLRQTAGMLAQKWSELSGKRRGGGGMADAAGLLLLHTAGSNLPGLRHCLEHGGVSPETAYLHLARLASQMCSFHDTISPTDIPAFSHESPGSCFHTLGNLLQDLLGDAAPSMCDTLDLQQEGESMFWAKIPSPNMLTQGALYLSVRADATEDEIQSQLPTLTKVTSKDQVQELLMRAIPGLPIRYVPQPPSSIPTQAGRTYFRLEPEGPHWESITNALTIALHVSPGLAKLDLELLAVKQ